MKQDSSHVDICYAQLRALIVTCEFTPGMRLNERGLMARLGFGRTPIREALLRLSQERLVDTIPRSGYRVRPLTRKSVIDFFDVWAAIGPTLVSLGVAGLTDGHRRQIEHLAGQRAELATDDARGMSRIAASFFDVLVQASDNEPLIYIYHRLGAELERIFLMFFGSPEGRRWLGTGAEIAAFRHITDPAIAVRIVQERIAASRRGVLELLDKQEAAGTPA